MDEEFTVEPTGKVKEKMINPLQAKESRADFRYQPLVKPLADVICMPDFKKPGQMEMFDRVLKHYGGEN